MVEQSEETSSQPSKIPLCFEQGHRMRMLVPVTEFSESIMQSAACMAKMLGADVHLLGVVPESDATVRTGFNWYPSYNTEALPGAGIPAVTTLESREQAFEATRQEAMFHLQQIAQQFAPLTITTRVLMSHSVGDAIVDYARDCEVDLIVMPTHGRERFAQAILGSIATHVVHSGVAPVLLVKPPEG
jgi:nucleotide-binding universal stress UspA family protein